MIKVHMNNERDIIFQSVCMFFIEFKHKWVALLPSPHAVGHKNEKQTSHYHFVHASKYGKFLHQFLLGKPSVITTYERNDSLQVSSRSHWAIKDTPLLRNDNIAF